MKLEVIDKKIKFKGGSLGALKTVLDAREIDDKIVVIYDYMEFPENGPARNMFAYSKSGLELWRAADIGMGSTDAYTNIISEFPLQVSNFAGFNVFFDLHTGKVISTEFTK